MTKTPGAAKTGMLVVGLVLAVAVGWFVAIGPKRSEAARLSTEIADTQAQIDAAQGPTAPGAAPIRVADLFELSRAMPDRVDIPNVLLQLSTIAGETGVSFESITPHDPVQLGDYQQIGIDLVFEGRFYDLSDFLYRLRNLVGVHDGTLAATGRLFSVDSIAFDEGQLQFPQVKAGLTVSAYVFGDGTAEPIAPSVSGAAQAAPTTTTETSTTPASAARDSQPIPAAPVAGA
jgi:Pilus assembly protein, PilO